MFLPACGNPRASRPSNTRGWNPGGFPCVVHLGDQRSGDLKPTVRQHADDLIGPIGEVVARAEPAPVDLTNPADLDRVWQEHRRWVAAIIMAYKPAWADVDDLLQEVAASLVRKGSEIREANAVRPWLRTVAINAARLAARTARSRPKPAFGGDQETSPVVGGSTDHAPPSQGLSDRQLGQRLMGLAAKLPDGYREPLLLKTVQGLSYREIGRILGLPETTIETRIARARKQLRDLAAEELEGAEELPGSGS